MHRLSRLKEVRKVFPMCPCIDLFIEFDNLSIFVDDNRYATAQTIWLVRRAEEQTDMSSCVYK